MHKGLSEKNATGVPNFPGSGIGALSGRRKPQCPKMLPRLPYASSHRREPAPIVVSARQPGIRCKPFARELGKTSNGAAVFVGRLLSGAVPESRRTDLACLIVGIGSVTMTS